MDSASNSTLSLFNHLSRALYNCLRNLWREGRDFVRVNPLYAPLLLVGIKCAVSSAWSLVQEVNDNVHTVSIDSLKRKYRGDWAFVADVSKLYGVTCASLLATYGYNILTLSFPDSSLHEQIKGMGRSLEVVGVSPFCSQFDAKDIALIEEALREKTVGIVVMNLFYESPCHFASEFPFALVGSVNACVIKTVLFLEVLLKHTKKQFGKIGLLTTGSILGDAAWPGFQVTSGCANSIEQYIANLNREKMDIVHVKTGYVPTTLKTSHYLADRRAEAERSLMRMGVYNKAFAHYRARLQQLVHGCRWGKPNRFAYARLGLLQRYFI
eukprot:TRINITY_DN11747_c0_g1_i2.p1 TRINITY_DN11747_c0_g1~~TRINITY_DN11747_c0_g1_i2.p1  ORF type:complete len:325 (-),score=54.68 TRINITY_DN11747_c0_g1_i2:140-1114(-)